MRCIPLLSLIACAEHVPIGEATADLLIRPCTNTMQPTDEDEADTRFKTSALPGTFAGAIRVAATDPLILFKADQIYCAHVTDPNDTAAIVVSFGLDTINQIGLSVHWAESDPPTVGVAEPLGNSLTLGLLTPRCSFEFGVSPGGISPAPDLNVDPITAGSVTFSALSTSGVAGHVTVDPSPGQPAQSVDVDFSCVPVL